MLTFDGIRIELGKLCLTADLSIPTEGITAVIGPSGAGKSTLLAAIGGFLDPMSGHIRWHKDEVTGLAPADRPVAMLFQDNNLFPHMTVAANVALGLTLGRPTPEQTEQVINVLDRVGLSHRANANPAEISGGEQSRAALARALLMHRPLLLLDEPFAALGPALKAEMLDLLAEIVAETDTTALMVTHDPKDARRIARRSILVVGGAVDGPYETGALLDDPPDAIRDYL